MYGNTPQSALSSCDGRTHLNCTRVLETVFFTLNEQTLHDVVNHSTSVVSETCRCLSLSATVNTVLVLLANQLLTSEGYFHRRDSSMGDRPQAEGALTLNDAVRQRTALLTGGECLFLRTLTATTDSLSHVSPNGQRQRTPDYCSNCLVYGHDFPCGTLLTFLF